MFSAFDLIPRQVFSAFSEVYRLRAQPRPVVAWHALENEPSPAPILLMLGIVFFALFISRQVQTMPLVVTRQLRHWLKDPLGSYGRQAQLHRLQEKSRHSVDKLLKVVHKCRTLQAQLKVRSQTWFVP